MGLNRNGLISVINDLKGKRPCFHSEDDFKFALAWKIKQKYPTAEIRLEKPMSNSGRKYLDIFLEFPGDSEGRVGIEVKYMTAELKASINGEQYDLTSHLAYPLRCYDCLLDIQRLEEFINQKRLDYGYALWLTNDKIFGNLRREKPFMTISEFLRGEVSGRGKSSNGEVVPREVL